MKNYEASKNIDGTYDIYGSDDNWYSENLEVAQVRGCNVRKTINSLYAKDSAHLRELLVSCEVGKADGCMISFDSWCKGVGL